VKTDVAYSLRRAWWRRFPPLVRFGWYVATAGNARPAARTAVGIGMMAGGILLRRSQRSRNKRIYVHTVNPGEATRIRVYRGTSPPSEVIVRT
jgi:hypothetical protein